MDASMDASQATPPTTPIPAQAPTGAQPSDRLRDSRPDALRAQPATTAVTAELTSVPQINSITVNHDNVLQAAHVLSTVLAQHGTVIEQNMTNLRVDPPGRDVISVQAAVEWNARLLTDSDSYVNRVSEYLRSLEVVAQNLAASAKQYGYSDQEIAAAFQQAGSASA
jgi:hypothetical protein